MWSLTHVVKVSPAERDKYHMKWCQLRTRLIFVPDGGPYTLKHELHTMRQGAGLAGRVSADVSQTANTTVP
ncbi:hypothetical protein [Burkholderia ubonensis]|uniref:hypothetical protein n=1 Tax=Burkholderia ubonensis TaxID=101571 RepID=UPI000F5834C9|nr:hypothetical protein [Burkholderia ubonensis]